MIWANVGWWLVYAFAAIALQSVIPGLDFLFPGFIIAMQERRLFQTLCVGAAFMLAQEGMGSMAFGGTLLWYCVAAIAYYVGCSLFQGSSLLFVFLFSSLLSGVHYIIFGMLASLQDIPWEAANLLDECFLQAVLTPVIWWVASLQRKGLSHEDRE